MSGRRGRGRRAVFVGSLAAGALLIIGGVAEHTLVYYRTPSEIVAHPDAGPVRLAGAVVPGTVHRLTDGVLAFDVTDGKHTVHVVSTGSTPALFRPGREAVVEGAVRNGYFVADRVLAKHGNTYRAPAQ